MRCGPGELSPRGEALSDELPPDPFIPDDPRFRDSPLAQDLLEAAQLMFGFVNAASLSSLVKTLQKADHHDLELVAMLALTSHVRDVFAALTEEGSLTADEAEAQFVGWLIGPLSDGTLDDPFPKAIPSPKPVVHLRQPWTLCPGTRTNGCGRDRSVRVNLI